MRRFILVLALAVPISLCPVAMLGCGGEQDNNKTGTEESVYVAKTGKKYHRTDNCKELERGVAVMQISLRDAKDMGYAPCTVCASK